MQKSQVNRAVVKARADARPSIRPTTTGTNPAMRVQEVQQGGNVGRQFGPGARGGSPGVGSRKGYRSDWARSPYAPFGGWQ